MKPGPEFSVTQVSLLQSSHGEKKIPTDSNSIKVGQDRGVVSISPHLILQGSMLGDAESKRRDGTDFIIV